MGLIQEPMYPTFSYWRLKVLVKLPPSTYFFKVIMLSAKLHTSYCLVLPLPLRKKAEGCIDKVF